MERQGLIEKIKRLPQDSVAEVEDFVDSLARREGILDRKSLHQALADYAIQQAGTDADLDPEIEAAVHRSSNHMSDEAFADLKKAMEAALAFERGKRRDLKVTRIQGPRPPKTLSPQPIAHLEGRE